METAVAYYRVSTDRQGKSGLGLAAQKLSVHQFIKSRKIKLIKEFKEVESGRKSKRPVLLQALQYCKDNNTVLIIARLNRLGRNVAFISALMESKVKFVSADLPEANHFMLHVLAAVAEYERDQISSNTKDALQAAKKRGVKLGTFGKKLALRNKKASEKFAKKMKPIIQQLQRIGFKTIQAITDELNRQKVSAFRPGARWHKSTVHKLLCQFHKT